MLFFIGLFIDIAYRKVGEFQVGIFFFLKCFREKFHRFFITQLFRKGGQSAVTGYLIMLYFLCRSD